MPNKTQPPIGIREELAIKRATAQGGRVNHLPSGKVSIEYRKRGEIQDYDTRDEFIEDFMPTWS